MIKTYGDRQPGLGTSAIVGALTLAKTGTTARTATFPDAAITVAGSASALTSGRVPFATTGGLLTDSPTLTFSAHTLGLGDGTSTPTLGVLGAAGTNRTIAGYTGSFANSARRWLFYLGNSDAESGANAGSNVSLLARDDAGNGIDTVFKILRVAGGNFEIYRPILSTGAVTVPNGTAAAPGIRLTSEASGLYRVGSTAIGISVAGAGAITVNSGNGSTFGPYATFTTPSAAEWNGFFSGRADSEMRFSGGSGSSAGGQFRLFGGAHATKADYVEFTRGNTVSAFFNGSGILTVNSTAVGSVALSGGMTLAAIAAGTTAGGLQRETNQDTHYAYTNAIGGWLDKCIFSQYASVTQSGIVTDQSLASATARGTRTLPANFFKAGKVLKFRLCGRYTTDAAAGNATIQIKLGTTVFRTSGSFALDNSVTNLPWELEGEITCLTTGASGTVEGISLWKHMITGATGNYDAEALAGTTSVTLNTTASQTFDVVWTADDAGTAITCTCFRLWEVC